MNVVMMHYCAPHKGDGAHYAVENCKVCQLQKEVEKLKGVIKNLEWQLQEAEKQTWSVRKMVVTKINRLGYYLMGVK